MNALRPRREAHDQVRDAACDALDALPGEMGERRRARPRIALQPLGERPEHPRRREQAVNENDDVVRRVRRHDGEQIVPHQPRLARDGGGFAAEGGQRGSRLTTKHDYLLSRKV
jgi:hypothetical protein